MDESQMVRVVREWTTARLSAVLKAAREEATELWRHDEMSEADLARLNAWLEDIAVAVKEGPRDEAAGDIPTGDVMA